MMQAMLAAQSREDFVAAVRALDRVLISGFYVVPLFHAPDEWVGALGAAAPSGKLVACRPRADDLVGRGVSAANDRRRLPIDVISDVVCPWCFIGKRRLEKAIALSGVPSRDPLAALSARSDHPAGGQGPARLSRGESSDRPSASGRCMSVSPRPELAEGIDFAFDRIEVSPNTLDAHRLIRWAGEAGRQDEIVEALFRAYFLDGRNIGDHAMCWRISPRAAGMDAR